MNKQQNSKNLNANLSHQQRVEAGKKAAETRGHESLSKAGQKGGRNSHKNDKSDNS